MPNTFSQKVLTEVSKRIDDYLHSKEEEPNKAFFAIRNLFIQIPELADLIVTPEFKKLVKAYAGESHFITKAIYFSKPKEQNWFVSYHQDLSINLKDRNDGLVYKNWIQRDLGYSVNPDKHILERTITFRIHLDPCDETSGALKVLSGSHISGVRKVESIKKEDFTEEMCCANSGDVLLMKPLLFHSSNRTVKPNRRRIIHIELCNQELKNNLEWLERINIEYD